LIIDIIYIVLLAMALFKGYRKGLVLAIFSIVGFIVGLAAALKLSAVVAGWLGDSTNISAKWLPVISFLGVFIVVVLIIRTAGKVLESTIEWAFLGWVNKLGGIVLYAAAYTIIYSVFLFYAEKLNLFSAETIKASVCYSFIEPWAPTIMNGIGAVIPWFKDMFIQLQNFFEKVSGNLKS
jgi:membrane protein required for colicin V production